MTAKELITKELKNFIKLFPQTRVRYEFHEQSNCHFIEVVPNDMYNLDDDYISWELEMYDIFTELCTVEGICFISDDALVGIKNPELTLYGTKYHPIQTRENSVTFDDISISSQRKTIGIAEKITFNDGRNVIEEARILYASSQTYLLAA